jgi:hypothetical protein
MFANQVLVNGESSRQVVLWTNGDCDNLITVVEGDERPNHESWPNVRPALRQSETVSVQEAECCLCMPPLGRRVVVLSVWLWQTPDPHVNSQSHPIFVYH